MGTENHFEKELGGQLLASVSRSFYLTLKALPQELREPLSLAYLLARTADTIADTSAVPITTRLSTLDSLSTLLQQPDAHAQSSLAMQLLRSFVPLQTDQAEKRLMSRFSEAFDWYLTQKKSVVPPIQSVLDLIIRGQKLDLERFPDTTHLRALKSEAELLDYTWLVAGCVGEFWTELCQNEKPESIVQGAPLQTLKEWGKRYGQGLQLLNILRDIGEDLRDGRCYLPLSGPDALHPSSEPLQASWHHWLGRCSDYMLSGKDYLAYIQDTSLRYATALPLFIGLQTLSKLKKATWDEVLSGVKISRIDIGLLLAEALIACRSIEGTKKLIEKFRP